MPNHPPHSGRDGDHAVNEKCPESVDRHGPADGGGRCPWCGRKYTHAVRPRGPAVTARLVEGYEAVYGQHGGWTEDGS